MRVVLSIYERKNVIKKTVNYRKLELKMRKLIFVFLLVFAGLNVFSNNEIPNDLFFLGLNGKVKECISIVYANGKQEIDIFSHEYFDTNGFIVSELDHRGADLYDFTYYKYTNEENEMLKSSNFDRYSQPFMPITTYYYDKEKKNYKDSRLGF